MTAEPTPTPPARPSLEQADNKPDVTTRLRELAAATSDPAVVVLCADALDIIEDKREVAAWRLGEINRLKGELREHKDLLRRVTQDSEWSCMPADLQDDIEAAVRKPVVPMEKLPDQPAPPAARATEAGS